MESNQIYFSTYSVKNLSKTEQDKCLQYTRMQNHGANSQYQTD